MAGTTESGGGDFLELNSFLMDLPPRLISLRDNAVFVPVIQNPLQFRITCGAIDGLQQIAFYQGDAARGLVIDVGHPMTNNAGNAFAGGRMAFKVGDLDPLFHVHADLIVTADTEIAVGAVHIQINKILQRHVGRAQLRI